MNDDVMHILAILASRGFTVEIEGRPYIWVKIRTDSEDISHIQHGDKVEDAVFAATRALVAEMSETVEELKVYLDKYPAEDNVQ